MSAIHAIRTQNRATASQYVAAIRSVSESESGANKDCHEESVYAYGNQHGKRRQAKAGRCCDQHGDAARQFAHESSHNGQRVAGIMQDSTINSVAGVR